MVKSAVTTAGKNFGKDVFYSGMTIFLMGSGAFGGEAKGEDRVAATAANKIPSFRPDHERVVEDETTDEQAATYRLPGDYNTIYIDAAFARWVDLSPKFSSDWPFLALLEGRVFRNMNEGNKVILQTEASETCKQDVAEVMKPRKVTDALKLKLNQLEDKVWYVAPSCAVSGKGLPESLLGSTSSHGLSER